MLRESYEHNLEGDQPRNWPALDKLLFKIIKSLLLFENLIYLFSPLKLRTCLPLVKKKLQKLKKIS
jgi:hypothetical protein